MVRRTPKRQATGSNPAGGAKNDRCKPFFDGLQRFFVIVFRERFCRSEKGLGICQVLFCFLFYGMPFAQPGSLKMLRPTRSSAAYRYPLRRTGFWQHYLLDYDAYNTVGNTQKSTLSGASLPFRPG